MADPAPGESFWNFSVRTYRTENVPQACLSLQDEFGADVNLLLYCCWFGERAGLFDDVLFNAAIEFSDSWYKNVVAKLREARRWMKHTGCHTAPISTDSCMRLREQIKQVEFAAEKIQEESLESLTSRARASKATVPDILADIAANLARYCGHIGRIMSDDVQSKLAVIVCAAIVGVDYVTVVTALRENAGAAPDR